MKEFNEGVDRAIDYATALGCSQLNCLAGMPPAGADPADVRATFVGNLQRAASKLKTAGMRLLIEPINTRDIPNFFLSHTAQAIEIIRAVGSDNLFLQYNVYHMQIMEGDLTKPIERQLPQIAHMQVADPPLRNEPGSGEINFTNLFRAIDKLGYTGWIGCEYKPAGRRKTGWGGLGRTELCKSSVISRQSSSPGCHRRLVTGDWGLTTEDYLPSYQHSCHAASATPPKLQAKTAENVRKFAAPGRKMAARLLPRRHVRPGNESDLARTVLAAGDLARRGRCR